MKSMPIRYVRDLDAARSFYEALGLIFDMAIRPPRTGPSRWTELKATEGGLALHYVPPDEPSPEFSMSLESDEPLETVVERLRVAGYAPTSAIIDESFGRSFTVRDPEGMLIQVNEHDRTLGS